MCLEMHCSKVLCYEGAGGGGRGAGGRGAWGQGGGGAENARETEHASGIV